MSDEERPELSIPVEFLQLVNSISNKRARIVIEHILKNGHITTEDLEKTYGYSHPPRAARDVREAGIPLITFQVKSGEGKSIAAYKFGDLTVLAINRSAGRKPIPKKLKKALYESCNGKCAICQSWFEDRYLQVDHKVPYEVGGDVNQSEPSDYMLLCGSCNRGKSWSCEGCKNWKNGKDANACITCYWGNPTSYTHIAMNNTRRIDLVWDGESVLEYQKLSDSASEAGVEIHDFAKNILKDGL